MISTVNSQQFPCQTQVLLYLLAGLEKQRHCWYLSCLLPQHSASFTAQSCQAETIINFSHVAIDPIFVQITVLFQRKLAVPPRMSNVQSFLEKYMWNFQRLVALGNQNFSATKNIPCDSTTFPLSADALKKGMRYTVRKLRSVKQTWPWMTKMGARTS